MPPSLTAPAWCLHPSLCLSRASLYSGTQEGTRSYIASMKFRFWHDRPLVRSSPSPLEGEEG